MQEAIAGLRWIDIAHELGYHDQAHMVHDFQRLAGSNPADAASRMDMFALDDGGQPQINVILALRYDEGKHGGRLQDWYNGVVGGAAGAMLEAPWNGLRSRKRMRSGAAR